MPSLISRFNSRLPAWARLGIVAVLSLATVAVVTSEHFIPTLWALSVKLRGAAPHCPWSKIWTLDHDVDDLWSLIHQESAQCKVIASDNRFGIELVSHPSGNFWIRRSGSDMDGSKLIGYLEGEHRWVREMYPDKWVRPGEIVLDCGAHVGTFTRGALQAGAAKVVAIDPDPTQVECLRRNFAPEIESGKVVVVPKGVWSSDGSLSLSIGTQNSGMSSLVIDRGGDKIDVPLITIDELVTELGLPRVDYIKLDIEGAEREALKGAHETLNRYGPRLLIDSYHRKDDMDVLPEIILQAHPAYKFTCGSCDISGEFGGIVPHYTFYE